MYIQTNVVLQRTVSRYHFLPMKICNYGSAYNPNLVGANQRRIFTPYKLVKNILMNISLVPE